MKIGVDILGGDHAPEATVLGSIMASREIPKDIKLVLIGDEGKICEICKQQNVDPSVFEIVHTTDSIGMNEHPAKAFSQKPKSSIAIGFHLLEKGLIDGFASAGNTGAMLVGAMYTIKTIPGIIRPVIGSHIPNNSENLALILDVGLNPDAKPEILYQYAIIGSLYVQHVFGIKNPRVALLNIGEEEEKGNIAAKAVYPMLKESKVINFIGNIEGNNLLHEDKADVIVCDGFVGNIVLKQAEGFYTLTRKLNFSHDYFEYLNYENVGGTPILGVNGVAVIGHGKSNAKAVSSMIKQTIQVAKANLIEKINEAFK